MIRLTPPHAQKKGQVPGSAIFVGRHLNPLTMQAYSYSVTNLSSSNFTLVDQALAAQKQDEIFWLNLWGLADTDAIQQVAKAFNIHPLVVEDIVNTGHRPKAEVFEDQVYVVLKMLNYNKEQDILESEQVSLVLGSNWVITFQERPGDVFDTIRQRIEQNRGKIRKQGADWLAYCLLDVIADNYFEVLEQVGNRVEAIEETALKQPTQELLAKIRHIKRQVVYLRRSVWPLREAVALLMRDESEIFGPETRVYLHDLYDHVIQVIDTVETFGDMVVSLQDVYLSALSNRMNEVMKVLTIIATMFIPLTFVAGVYGMNFEFMPELHWRWGYQTVWVVFGVSLGLMFWWFKRKKWL